MVGRDCRGRHYDPQKTHTTITICFFCSGSQSHPIETAQSCCIFAVIKCIHVIKCIRVVGVHCIRVQRIQRIHMRSSGETCCTCTHIHHYSGIQYTRLHAPLRCGEKQSQGRVAGTGGHGGPGGFGGPGSPRAPTQWATWALERRTRVTAHTCMYIQHMHV